ncbi:hypothetical protein FA743_02465 [Paracoccus gahaiensis]|uniref:Uncharacterized protein n=1 Tax=Paracoccus gahaiensis TaxID=1706839 RepID=A0A4U0RFM2_9RHOB|nr:hypothetical protein FA743_02465 [Paracoccus gahaiensis]
MPRFQRRRTGRGQDGTGQRRVDPGLHLRVGTLGLAGAGPGRGRAGGRRCRGGRGGRTGGGDRSPRRRGGGRTGGRDGGRGLCGRLRRRRRGRVPAFGGWR